MKFIETIFKSYKMMNYCRDPMIHLSFACSPITCKGWVGKTDAFKILALTKKQIFIVKKYWLMAINDIIIYTHLVCVINNYHLWDYLMLMLSPKVWMECFGAKPMEG